MAKSEGEKKKKKEAQEGKKKSGRGHSKPRGKLKESGGTKKTGEWVLNQAKGREETVRGGKKGWHS